MVATNENDVLHEFFSTGNYRPRRAAQTFVTSSPSMDISKASNFERFIYLLLQKNSEDVTRLWNDVASGQGFGLANNLAEISERYGFVSGKSTHADRVATIREVYQTDGELIDPHTADGVGVARRLRKPNETVICAETALPAKFAETIFEAVGDVNIPRPQASVGLEYLPQHVLVLANDANLVKAEIDKLTPSN